MGGGMTGDPVGCGSMQSVSGMAKQIGALGGHPSPVWQLRPGVDRCF